MSKDAIAALRLMEHGQEFAYERGVGYIGHVRVKKATRILAELVHAMAVRRVPTEGCETEYYRIGHEGRAALHENIGRLGDG